MSDRKGFDAFVGARSPRLLRTAYLLTRDAGHAEDLLQTALVKAWRAWPRLQEDPEAYVRRVLVTTWSSWWRRRWRAETPTEQLPEVLAGAADDLGERELLWAALGRLPRRQRAVVVLRFYEDLPVAEVARLLGVSDGTVKSQTSKALSTLRVDPELVREPTSERR